MRKISYLLVAFLLAGIVSCEEVEDLNKDKFTFKVNGEEIDYSDRAEYGILENLNAKIIRGRKNDSILLMITVPEFQEQRYVSEVDEVSFIYTTEDGTYSSEYENSNYDVEVRIDDYEEETRIEGTFSGTVYEIVGSDSIEIKDGEFRVNQ